jgi:hypothetical protein
MIALPYPRTNRRYVNPRFRDAYRRSRCASWELALRAGFPPQSHFSSLIRAESIPATALNVERLRRVAMLLDFDPDKILLGEEPAGVGAR